MKSVLISIQPKWCEKIANGEKTIEVRKTKPKLETPFKCYIYKTKKRILRDMTHKGDFDWWGERAKELSIISCPDLGGGKIIGEFICDKTYYFLPHLTNFGHAENPFTKLVDIIEGEGEKHGLMGNEHFKALKNTALSQAEIYDYANGKVAIYGWHISDLKIYDKPKALSEFRLYNECVHFADYDLEKCCACKKALFDECGAFCGCDDEIKRPPQSWCYIEK